MEITENELRAADHLDPVKYAPATDDLPVLTDQVTADAIEKINVGAALAYALYHTHDLDWFKNAPATVHRAIARAQAAYGIGRHR